MLPRLLPCIKFPQLSYFEVVGLLGTGIYYWSKSMWSQACERPTYVFTNPLKSCQKGALVSSNMKLVALDDCTVIILELWPLGLFCRPSWNLAAVVSIITVGLVLMVKGETQYNPLGFTLVMSAAMLSGLRWTITQVLLQGSGSDGHGKHPVLCPILCFLFQATQGSFKALHTLALVKPTSLNYGFGDGHWCHISIPLASNYFWGAYTPVFLESTRSGCYR